MVSKEEAISTTGVYGLADHRLNHMLMLLDRSTVSLVHKHCPFGKQSHKSLMKQTENTSQMFSCHTKSTAVDSALFNLISPSTCESH